MSDHPEGPTAVDHALLQKEMEDLRRDFDTLATEVRGLVDAWKTATGIVAFVKWLAGFATAVGLLWAAVKLKIGA